MAATTGEPELRRDGNMNDNTVFARTAKGTREASGRVHTLTGELHDILERIDGQASVGALTVGRAGAAADEFRAALARLAERGYIRAVAAAPAATAVAATPVPAPAPAPAAPASGQAAADALAVAPDDSLDFTTPPPSRAADVPAAGMDGLAGQLLRQASATRGQEAHEPPPQADAEQDAAATDRKTRARQEAAAATTARAEARARRKAEKTAQREAEAVRRRIGRVDRKEIRWGKPLAAGLLLLLLIALGLVHVVPFNGQIPRLANAAAAQFGLPVRIGSVHLSLLPQPHWRLDAVTIGADGQIRAPRIDAFPTLGTLFGAATEYKAIALHAPIINDEGLGQLLFGSPQGRHLGFAQVKAVGAKVDSRYVMLPIFDATANVGSDGAWTNIALVAVDRSLNLKLRPAQGQMQVEVASHDFAVPFGSTLVLKDFKAKGTARRDGLALTEFEGRGYDGVIAGNVNLKWSPAWRLDGNVRASRLDAAQVLPSLLESGRLEGHARLALAADDPARLFAAPRVEGNFVIGKGVLLGVDLGHFPHSGEGGGRTVFSRLTGEFARDGAVTRLRQVALGAGIVSALGSVEMGENRNLRGRFVVDLAFRRVRARAVLSVSGTLDVPHFQR